MKTLFILSLLCAVLSLVAVFCFSAMTFAPNLGAERKPAVMMLVAGTFGVAWFSLALWTRARQRASSQSLPPQWLRRLLVSVAFVYLLGILLVVVG